MVPINDIFMEDFFVMPVVDIEEYKAGDLLMADCVVNSFNPELDEVLTYVKLKNNERLIPIQYFALIQSIVDNLN